MVQFRTVHVAHRARRRHPQREALRGRPVVVHPVDRDVHARHRYVPVPRRPEARRQHQQVHRILARQVLHRRTRALEGGRHLRAALRHRPGPLPAVGQVEVVAAGLRRRLRGRLHTPRPRRHRRRRLVHERHRRRIPRRVHQGGRHPALARGVGPDLPPGPVPAQHRLPAVVPADLRQVLRVARRGALPHRHITGTRHAHEGRLRQAARLPVPVAAPLHRRQRHPAIKIRSRRPGARVRLPQPQPLLPHMAHPGVEVAHRVAGLAPAQREARHRRRVARARHHCPAGPLRRFQRHRDRRRRRRGVDRRGGRRRGRARRQHHHHGLRRGRRRTYQRRGRSHGAAHHPRRHLVVEPVRTRIRDRIRPLNLLGGVVGVRGLYILCGGQLEFPIAVLLHAPHAIARSLEMGRRVRQGRVRDPRHLHRTAPDLRLQLRWHRRPGPPEPAGGAGLVHLVAAHPAHRFKKFGVLRQINLPPAPPGLLHHRVAGKHRAAEVHMGACDGIAPVDSQRAQGIGRGPLSVLERGRNHINSIRTPVYVHHRLRRQGWRAGFLDLHGFDVPKVIYMALVRDPGCLVVFPLNPEKLAVSPIGSLFQDHIAADLAVREPARTQRVHQASIVLLQGVIHGDKTRAKHLFGVPRKGRPHTQ